MVLKRTGGTRRFEQCALFVFRRMLDSNWEWSLCSVERDPGEGISSVKGEGGNCGMLHKILVVGVLCVCSLMCVIVGGLLGE